MFTQFLGKSQHTHVGALFVDGKLFLQPVTDLPQRQIRFAGLPDPCSGEIEAEYSMVAKWRSTVSPPPVRYRQLEGVA